MESLLINVALPIVLGLIASYPAVLAAKKQWQEAQNKREKERAEAEAKQEKERDDRLEAIRAGIDEARTKMWNDSLTFQNAMRSELERCNDQKVAFSKQIDQLTAEVIALRRQVAKLTGG